MLQDANYNTADSCLHINIHASILGSSIIGVKFNNSGLPHHGHLHILKMAHSSMKEITACPTNGSHATQTATTCTL